MKKNELKFNLIGSRKNSIFYFVFSIFCVSILLSIFYFLFSRPVFAAQVNLGSDSQNVAIGEQFKVDVILNAEGEELNAIEGNILFPDNLIALNETKDGNSIISFWIERPKTTSEGKIEFSGIIPGGYKEANGFLFSAVFVAKTDGQGIVKFQNARVLKNDGLGTPVSLAVSNFQFLISKQVPIPQIPTSEVKDNDPPEKFRPEIASDPALFDGKYFLVFATQDKGSGIDHYEIRENRKWKIENRNWVRAESPYVVKDQELRSLLYVKAVDKAGNERIVVVEPRYPIQWYEVWWVWGIIAAGVVVAYVMIRKKIESRK